VNSEGKEASGNGGLFFVGGFNLRKANAGALETLRFPRTYNNIVVQNRVRPNA
jgi:hypothetical protein